MSRLRADAGNKEQEFPLLEHDQEQGYENDLDDHVFPKVQQQQQQRLWRSTVVWFRRKPWRIIFLMAVVIIASYFLFHVFGGLFVAGPVVYLDLPTTLRPALHFATPPETWLNDPNGLFQDSKGLWHMYYQHLPTWEAGNCKNWAHATSLDLYNWTLHPLALECKDYAFYSGSIVLDKDNTSGFFPEGHIDGVVAIYTEHHVGSEIEQQAIAYSLDGGYTFVIYKKNPVLKLEPESYNFRDPKVRWHPETGKWVMVVAYAHAQQVAFYTSHNLIDWLYTSSFQNPFLSHQRPSFECPGLEQIPHINADEMDSLHEGIAPQGTGKTWVLFLSNGGGSPFNGGSLTRYFPGDFNGTHFEPFVDRADLILDFGTDNYATQHFHGLPETSLPVSFAWAANIATCADLPSGPREHWRGIMSLPRYGALVKSKKGSIYYWSQAAQIEKFRGKDIFAINTMSSMDQTTSIAEVKSGAVILDAHVTRHSAKPSELSSSIHFLFRSSKTGEELDCYVEFRTNDPGFGCDRSKAAGFETSEEFKTMFVGSIPRADETFQDWDVQIIFDISVIEVYLGKGLQAGTMAFFPQEPLDTFVIRSNGSMEGLAVDARLSELNIM